MTCLERAFADVARRRDRGIAALRFAVLRWSLGLIEEVEVGWTQRSPTPPHSELFWRTLLRIMSSYNLTFLSLFFSFLPIISRSTVTQEQQAGSDAPVQPWIHGPDQSMWQVFSLPSTRFQSKCIFDHKDTWSYDSINSMLLPQVLLLSIRY